MSHFDYTLSREFESKDYPFAAIIMGAMRRADSYNLEKLKLVFPEIWEELHYRYNAPGGMLPSELADKVMEKEHAKTPKE